MATKNYNTRTASLKATIADVRVLDAKKMNLDGKNILEYISESEFDSYDSRDPQLKNDELDIWNTEISLSEEGHIEVKPKEHTYEEMTDEQKELLLNSAAEVIDNEVLDSNGNHLMYWQTDGLTYAIYNVDKDNDGEYDANLSVFCHFDYSDDLLSNLNLNIFSSDLSSLTIGDCMFSFCYAFTSFSSALPSLTDGICMFESCTALSSFNSDLPSLTNGQNMFYGCNNLTTFNANLSNLTYGSYMFYENSLTSFSSNLSSLTNGDGMFLGCKLDAPSVANIVHTLPTHESNGVITIGIGCDATEADALLFTQECDCDTWQELLDEFSAKNWEVEFQLNGRPTETATYNMRSGETLPIYTKLEEVIMPTNENERKPHYAYTSQDGSKFYNINYFHSTNGSTEGYDVFSSLEEAISTYNVTPKN